MKTVTLGILAFFCTTLFWVNDSRKQGIEINNLNDSIITINKNKEHLRQYVNISFRLDSVCNQFKSSRELKRKLKITLND